MGGGKVRPTCGGPTVLDARHGCGRDKNRAAPIGPHASLSAMAHQPRIAEALTELAAEAPVALTVRGDCMVPLLTDGQRVEVKAARRYWPGDVIAFSSPTGELVVHRVIGYRSRRGRVVLQTRADASGTLDQPVAPARVLGRVEGLRVGAGARLRALWRFARLALGGHLPG